MTERRLANEYELPFDPPLPMGLGDSSAVSARTNRRTDSAIDGIAVSTVNPANGRSHLMYVSENLAAMLGCEPHQLLGQSPGVLFTGTTPVGQLEAVAELVDGGHQAVVEVDLRHQDGEAVPVQASFLSIPAHASSWPYYLALYRNLSVRPSPERLLADQADVLDALARGEDLAEILQVVSERLKFQVPGVDCWIAVLDDAGSNSAIISGRQSEEEVEEIVHYLTQGGGASTYRCARLEDLPQPLSDRLSGTEVYGLWSFPVIGPGKQRQATIVVTHPDRVKPDSNEHSIIDHYTRVVAVAVERTRNEASLAHQALHDSLTKLPNRALILDRLDQAIARLGRDNNKLAALLIDIDGFKSINEVRGIEAGDTVLIETARRLFTTVRLGDTLGRIGGGKFLILCVAVDGQPDAEAMADRVLDVLSGSMMVAGGDPVNLSASIGIALTDSESSKPAEVISNAEIALEKAIAKGRGGYMVHEAGQMRSVVLRHRVEEALRVAIDSDELVVHYQPLVDIETGLMIGAEALVRWDRPGHGLLPPSEFIEIAEQSGIIIPLGTWVIDRVCRDLADWPERRGSSGPVVTVNLSARQLSDGSLVGTIIGLMEHHGISSKNIGFEVTESMGIEDMEMAGVSLRRLSALGCKLAIDDFGIGYATLDYLRRFSMADTIKIDRSFVSGLGTSREDSAIVSASVALADSLGLSVVAEGVESYDQYAELRAMGCQVAQGYVLSPPVPLERAHELWMTGHLIDLTIL